MDTSESTLASSPVAAGNKMFTFSPEENQFSFKTTDKNITVRCSGGKHDRGSSKLKLVDVVSYKWEVKHYPGRLIACHKECKLFAYAITVTKLSKSEGMVRVAQLKVAERGIIRGLSNEVLDIQFAHTSSPDYLLGIIERTTLQVHQVFVKGSKVSTALKVKIVDPLEGHVPVCDRINWCPYLRENDYEEDDFASQLLVWTRGPTFQCYSISTLTKTYADTTDLKAIDIDEGGFKATDGEATITGSVFSADGTTLALSSTDGMIRFYQVYQHANDCSPRRLHQWKPHGGRPVSAFFFLDNYTETVDDKVLWKHAITCADNNTEVRVWCCESWECLQTVRLESPIEQPLNFKAEIDLSSTYLVLSDMNTRQIYVLQIRKGSQSAAGARSGLTSPTSSAGRELDNETEPDQEAEPQWKSRAANLARGGKVIRRADQSSVKPHIVSIAEYPISTMILGFSIIYARVGNYLLREQDDDDEDQSLPSCMVIRMFLVQSGLIQDCTLVYDPVEEAECDLMLAIAESEDGGGDGVGSIEQELIDGNDTQTSQTSSGASSSSSTETTDNNMSHPPSEASDPSIALQSKSELSTTAVGGAPKALGEDSSIGSASGSNSNNDSREDGVEEEEEEGAEGNGRSRAYATSNLLKLNLVEAAQKLTDVIDAMSPGTAATADAGVTNPAASVGTSGPTTPASTSTKVNLMTPESFSTPSGRGSRTAKDGGGGREPPKDVRIINLSELPYPEVETIMSQFDRRHGRGRGRLAAAGPTGSRENDSSVTSTASANGSVCSSADGGSRSTSEDEGGAGGNNTSIASIAGSERVANITDDPDDDEDNQQRDDDGGGEEDAENVIHKLGAAGDGPAKGKEKSHTKVALANGSPGVAEQGQKKTNGPAVLNVSGTMLNVEHFTKILTLDEAEPPTAREKNKSDETVHPNVLSTLFMLANATKQQQQNRQQQQQHPTAPSVIEMVSSSANVTLSTVPDQPGPPSANALQAFVNMVQSRAANEEASTGHSKPPASGGKLRKSTNGPIDGPSDSSVPPEIPPMPSAEMLASGGSSPSREVQEIMSTKGSGLNLMVDDLFQLMCSSGQRKDVYDDDEDDVEDNEDADVEEDEEGVLNVPLESNSIANNNISQFDEEDGVVPVTSNGPQQAQADGKEKVKGATKSHGVVEAVAPSSSSTEKPAADGARLLNAIKQVDDSSHAVGESNDESGTVVKGAAAFWPPKVPTEVPESSSSNSTGTLMEIKKAHSLKRSSMPLPASAESSAPPQTGPAPVEVIAPETNMQIQTLTGKIDRMMEVLVTQSRQIVDMNRQLEAMRKEHQEDHQWYSAFLHSFQQKLPKEIETQLSICFSQQNTQLEQALLTSFGNVQVQLMDALKANLTRALVAQLPERVSTLVMRDLHQKLLSPIGSKLDVLQRTLSIDVSEKLRAFEAPLRESIHRTLQSEQFVSQFGTMVQSDMRVVVEKSMLDALRTTILPGYEANNRELFRQASVSFSNGLKEFMRKIDVHITRVLRTQERADELLETVRRLPEEITANGERSAATAVRVIREHLEKDMKVLQTPLLKTIREHIRQEIEKGFEAQASSLEDSVLSVVRSQAQTPAPSNVDVQEQIKQYLNAGQINKAFHKALLSNDLSLVEFLLERADHKLVFNPCPLEQTVLLSLIQQISADMTNHNELKHKYLSDAIVSLDFHDPITKEHSPKVMLELINNCQTFMTANPTSSLCTGLKMLIIAVQFMGFKQF